jgi:predicted RNA methylase
MSFSFLMNLARVLHRLPDLRLHLDARNELTVTLAGRAQVCGPHALRLLEIFSRPIAVGEALEVLKPTLTGTQDWMLALRTIQQLEVAGVLTDEDGQGSEAPFDRASIHIDMLNDRGRTEAFIKAIQQTVNAGDVVVDLGTGTGILAVAAVKAGARKVYAIEAGAVRHQAEALFRDNGCTERIEIVPGWSTQVALPESADVVLGELLGNDPFGEDITEVYRDAVRRFLKPGGKVLPLRVELWALLVTVPEEITARHRFESSGLAVWEKAYGIKFKALKPTDDSVNFTVMPQSARKWTVLSQPVNLKQADLTSGNESASPDMAEIAILGDGLVNGMLLFFTATLCDGVQLSTNPATVTEDGHWRNVVRLFPMAQEVRQGQLLKLDCTAGYLKALLKPSASL